MVNKHRGGASQLEKSARHRETQFSVGQERSLARYHIYKLVHIYVLGKVVIKMFVFTWCFLFSFIEASILSHDT